MRISDWSSDVCSSDLRLIDRREDHSRRLLNDTIIRRRDAQWAHFTIALGDIDPPHWTRAVTAFRHALDQTVEPRQRHAVEGLSVHSRRHRTPDRKRVVSGKSVSVRVDFGGCRLIKKQNT